MSMADDIISAIQVLVEAEVTKRATQILVGVISDTGDNNKSIIDIGGKSYTLPWYGSPPSLNQVCRVFVPNGNMAGAFILNTKDSGGTITSISTVSPITGGGTTGSVSIGHDNSGVTAGTYKSVTVDAKGHVTAGTNPNTIAGYGITDAKIDSNVITLGSNTASAVPVTTSTDNGKFLVVSNGSPAWQTVPQTAGQYF